MMRQKRSRRSTNKHPVIALYDAYQDGTLADAEAAAYRQHLTTCDECQGWADRQSRLTERLQIEALPQATLSPAAAARIQQDITKRMRRALMVSNVKSTVGAAAAVVVLAVVVGIFIWQARDVEQLKLVDPSGPDVAEVEEVPSDAVSAGEVSDELLVEAVAANDPAEVERLLKAGISPTLTDSSGRSLMEVAMVGARISGDTNVLELLVEHGAEAKILERQVLSGQVGASDGIIEILMEKGADINVLLPLAVEQGLLESVQMLLEAGANANGTKYVTGTFPGNYPALTLAVMSNSPNIVELLIAHGADVNRGDMDMSRTALHGAAFNNRPEIAQILIDNGADLEAKSSFGGGQTPLHFAAAGGSLKAARVLVNAGADVDAQSSLGTTPLMALYEISQQSQIAEFVTLLLEAGADPNAQDRIGYTALHFASEQGFVVTIPILLEHGADPNLANEAGETPLDVASSEEVAELLRQAGVGG